MPNLIKRLLAQTMYCITLSGIAEIINEQGLINVDFEDVKTVMSEQGKAMMGMQQYREWIVLV